jgi:L-cysteate sulfo-lyase
MMMGLTDMPRTGLGFFPTPVQELKRLSSLLGGPQIYIKRDDQSGVGLGGNKIRKLEYLIADALSRGADSLVTGGAAQSNHCRQTAAAAAMSGLTCHLALGGEDPGEYQGNLLLDHLLGAELHWCGEYRKGETIPDICAELHRDGSSPYIIPYGGSNPVGATGFVEAMRELAEQQSAGLPPFSHIVFASSSGGTHAGMLVGGSLFQKGCQLIGIGIDKEDMKGDGLGESILRLADNTAKLIGLKAVICEEDLILRTDYLGEGYGIVGDPEREAIALAARYEGILLDPVYTGRAMAGLLAMIRNEEITRKDTVLFWHTGGTPALFAYTKELFYSG